MSETIPTIPISTNLLFSDNLDYLLVQSSGVLQTYRDDTGV